MIYVTADLHGYEAEKFFSLLEKAQFSEKDTLYVLGDVIDRGKDGIRLLKWLMRQRNVYLIAGNHEQLMLSCSFIFDEIDDVFIDGLTGSKLDKLSNWLANGGDVTIEAIKATRNSEMKYILEYLEEASLYEEVDVGDKKFVLVHSGLGNFSKDKPLEDYTARELLWTRPTKYDKYFDDKITVFGHTPTVFYDKKNPGRAYFTPTWIDIDTGVAAGFAPMLLRLDDMETFYL